MIGTTAGSYRITDVVSVGGMGTVYRAEHTLIGRIAAVKILHPELTQSQDIVHRFFNEAKATTSIKHPGIVEIYDYGHLESGHAYLVMEFLDGRTLAARNKQRGAIQEAEAAALLRGVCSALAAAHARGIVHRDLKPDNLFLVPDPESQLGERVKILDFGIAKLTDIGLAGTATKTGAVMGTPTYMSPEQCKGTGDVDHRADLYSIGCIFYEMICGRPPFDARGAGELIGAHLFMEPQRPSTLGAQLSPEAEALIMSLLAKNPAQRPQTAVELGQLLANLATRGGYGSSTNWERPSMRAIPTGGEPTAHFTPSHTPAPQHTPAHFTPSHASAPTHFTPAPGVPVGMLPGHGPSSPHLTPGHGSSSPYIGHGGSSPQFATPYPPARHTPMPGATLTDKPTTLSGAASQTTEPPKKSAKKLFAVLASVAFAGGLIATFMIIGGRGDGDDATPTGHAHDGSHEHGPGNTHAVKPAKAAETPSTPDTAKTDVKPADGVAPGDATKTTDAAKPGATPGDTTKPVDATKPPEAAKPVEGKPDKKKTGQGTKPKHPNAGKKTTDPLLETDL